jgi:hypothetical protein
MALSNESWDQIMRVVTYKLAESSPRHISLDPNAFLKVMRDNWELLCDHAAVVAYLAEKDLAAKKKARDEAIAQAEALAAEIEELET